VAAWRISEEDFFKLPAVNELKLKASYGKVGNDAIGAYAYQGGYSPNNNAQEPGYIYAVIGNRDLTWGIVGKPECRVLNFPYSNQGSLVMYNIIIRIHQVLYSRCHNHYPMVAHPMELILSGRTSEVCTIVELKCHSQELL
jgi:hypothetical protein